MRYCDSCKVKIAGRADCCPLCRGPLTGEGDPGEEVFPRNVIKSRDHKAFMQLVSFIAVAAAVVCVTVNILLPSRDLWCLFAVAGIGCGWIGISVGRAGKSNALKFMFWELLIIWALSLFWDVFTHWRGWSIDYVFPCTCMVAMGAMFAWAKIKNIPGKEYVIYLVVDACFGVVPLVFLLTGVLNVRIPSILCVAFSIISIAAILIFQRKNMTRETSRRLHL